MHKGLKLRIEIGTIRWGWHCGFQCKKAEHKDVPPLISILFLYKYFFLFTVSRSDYVNPQCIFPFCSPSCSPVLAQHCAPNELYLLKKSFRKNEKSLEQFFLVVRKSVINYLHWPLCCLWLLGGQLLFSFSCCSSEARLTCLFWRSDQGTFVNIGFHAVFTLFYPVPVAKRALWSQTWSGLVCFSCPLGDFIRSESNILWGFWR